MGSEEWGMGNGEWRGGVSPPAGDAARVVRRRARETYSCRASPLTHQPAIRIMATDQLKLELQTPTLSGFVVPALAGRVASLAVTIILCRSFHSLVIRHGLFGAADIFRLFILLCCAECAA